MATIPSISQQHQAPFEGNYQINFGQGGFSGTQSAAPHRLAIGDVTWCYFQ